MGCWSERGEGGEGGGGEREGGGKLHVEKQGGKCWYRKLVP